MRRDWPGFGRDTRRYMQGHCCDLAVALQEIRPGAEIVGIGGSRRFTDHAAVRVGGLYLDARGLSDEEGFREGLGAGDGEIFAMTRDDALGQMGLAHMAVPRSPDLSRARSVARALDRWARAQPEAKPGPGPLSLPRGTAAGPGR